MVQRKHCGPEEATWKIKDAMQFTHPFCSNLQSIEGGASVAFC